jgi:hypothetical protein
MNGYSTFQIFVDYVNEHKMLSLGKGIINDYPVDVIARSDWR